MSLIIDILIIAVAAVSVYLGAARGFIKSVMHFLSLVIALVCVVTLSAPLAEWLEESIIHGEISKITTEAVESVLPNDGTNYQIDTLFSETPEVFTDIADRFSIDISQLLDFFSEHLRGITDDIAIEKLSSKIAEPTASALSFLLAALLIFIAASVVLKLITFILDKIFHLPVLRTLNRFLGFFLGICSAAVSCWLLANFAAGLTDALGSINRSLFNESVIEGSVILKFFFDNGFIVI